jgi:trk system potassium uptake protein TrkA
MKRTKSVIVGSGRLGASIAAMLSDLGQDVLIVDKEQTSFRKLSETFSGYDIIGDATDMGILENEVNIQQADEVIITTDSDNINLFIAHLCYYVYHVPHIYVRFTDNDKGLLIENTSIKTIYPFLLSIDDFFEKRKQVTK